jgi:biopolymer transport protein ExbD
VKLEGLTHEDRPIAGVNIVPVIDLCLVLLIILMVTSPLLETSDLPVKLPQALTIENKEKNIAITYSPDGRLAINTTLIPDDMFIPELRKLLKEDPNVLVILRVDKTSPYMSLTELIERCKRAGARNVSIGTEQRPPKAAK